MLHTEYSLWSLFLLSAGVGSHRGAVQSLHCRRSNCRWGQWEIIFDRANQWRKTLVLSLKIRHFPYNSDQVFALPGLDVSKLWISQRIMMEELRKVVCVLKKNTGQNYLGDFQSCTTSLTAWRHNCWLTLNPVKWASVHITGTYSLSAGCHYTVNDRTSCVRLRMSVFSNARL